MKEIISKEEINLMLKIKKRNFFSCRECPINTLKIRNGMKCKEIVYRICGKEPISCKEAIKFLYNFFKKFEQNKI